MLATYGFKTTRALTSSGKVDVGKRQWQDE
jgi:hypothetical protein